MSGGGWTGGKVFALELCGAVCAPAAATNPMASAVAIKRFMTHLLP
jgi:hypothetical protein